MTVGLREAMDDVRRSVAVLAARVRDAHAARVWAPLGFTSWETYCTKEFGISRAQAYRLLDVAHALDAIQTAVTAGGPQPVLPMMPGMPERRTHDYLWHGITSLFAAFNIADGTVVGELHRRHRAVEFKKFLVTTEGHR